MIAGEWIDRTIHPPEKEGYRRILAKSYPPDEECKCDQEYRINILEYDYDEWGYGEYGCHHLFRWWKPIEDIRNELRE